MRKFYSCSVGEENKHYDEDNLKRIIDKKAFVLHENTSQKGDYLNIKKEDILLLKYRGNFIAYGEALDIKKTTDEEWNLLAPVKEWFFHDISNPSEGIGIYGMKDATLGGSQYGTVKPLEIDFSIKKIKKINNDSQLFITIKNELRIEKETKNMKGKIDLLEYKKQIILQGPPGTGKTRLAKMLAHELTKSEVKLTPVEYIDWYIKNFKRSKKVKESNLYQSNLLREFTNEFPLEKIRKMSLDQYCLGKGSTTSFCYWIERGLKDLGRFSPGQAGANVYGVYYSQEDDAYKSTSKSPDELLNDIQIALTELIENEDYNKARDLFRFSFILKILNSYYPEKYFPILSQTHLSSIAKVFKINTKGLNDLEINKKINSVFYKLKSNHSSEISSFDLMSHMYNKFKIKENQFNEVLINVVDELGETKLIQFHPAYTYEDFVRGIVVESNQKSQVEYKVVNKTIANFAQKALENPTTNYVLIIDEINRANLSSVLGELIYALEYRYDEEKQNEKEAIVESMYAIKQNEKDLEGDNTLMLPTNLFIIGTMNTADRSVGHIDYAIKRRFAFVDVLPEIEPVHPLIKDEFIKISNLFIKDFDGTMIPNNIEKSDSLASDFRPEDVWIGHSYFICKKNNSNENEDADKAKPILSMKLKYEIIPLLKEYIKDGILNETEQVKKVMDELISKDFTK
ncbi:AAA family ATPase [Lutibacter sp.]|uniref:AAA family ATPase n=1 Tax=Lutibacter sp. TaxID=1925666 RepID=UPI0035651F1C